MYIYIYFVISMPFLFVHPGEKHYLPIMYTMYINASNNTHFYIHISLYMQSCLFAPLLHSQGRSLGIIGQYPSVSKSNQLHVDIFRFFITTLGYIYKFF